jgi:D-arabinose 1-dehydrogenase-like Zn-dependent alcohol dehydrogenase
VDVVADCVGSPTFNASLRSLRIGGRLIVIGNVVQEKAALNLGYIVLRGIQVIGTGGATRNEMAELLALHAEEPFSVQIHEQLALEQADRAQRSVRQGGLNGRIVLVPTVEVSGALA